MRTVPRSIHVFSIAATAVSIAWLVVTLRAQAAPMYGFTVSTYAGLSGSPGSADGPLATARFDNPEGLATDSSGNLFVVEEGNNTVRKITPGGVVSTIAGLAGAVGSADGTGIDARFNKPLGIAVADDGTLYVADTANSTIRKITPAGVVTTIAGLAGTTGSADGPGATARFNTPGAVAVDGTGNVFVADTFNSTIRKIAPDGTVSTYAGVATNTGVIDGPVSDARFFLPNGLAIGADGSIYVGDEMNHTVRKITPDGIVSTIAGFAGVAGYLDGQVSAARFNETEDVTVDAAGNVYVIDESNFVVRKITPAGLVTTIAGTPGVAGHADGTGSGASFGEMEAITVDRAGRLFIADIDNDNIRLAVRQQLVDNGDFSLGSAGWSATAESDMVWSVSNGVLQLHVAPAATPQSPISLRGAVAQSTGMPVAPGAPLVAQFDAGNSSGVRKRLNLLIGDSDLSDLAVCTFWLAPNAPMRTYQVRTHTNQRWVNAAIFFSPALENAVDDGGDYLVDNVSLQDGPATQSTTRTDCVDPTAPSAPGGAASGTLIVNGSFDAGSMGPWMVYGDSTQRINNGVFEFFRPGTPGTPAAVVLQMTGAPMPGDQVVTATVQLGNSSGVRKRVALLLHDSDFSDLSVCTFWLTPNQSLSSYTMRTFATKAWTNSTLSLYAATIGSDAWIRLDNVTFERTSTLTTVGTQCLEPGDSLASEASGRH